MKINWSQVFEEMHAGNLFFDEIEVIAPNFVSACKAISEPGGGGNGYRRATP